MYTGGINIKITFQKDIQDSMRDCILAIFWPKKEIISFFQNNNCTSNDLKDVQNFKEPEMKRAEIVDRVFEKLQMRDDGGLGQFRSMLHSLINWSNFDPYYFEKIHKLNKDEALRRISHLKQLQEIRDEKLKQQQKNHTRMNEEASKSKKTFEDLRSQFTMLYQGKDKQGNIISLQKRGYLLESFLRELCLYEKLSVTEPFKITGEQIDGAIKFEGENYIIEAKWQDWPTASEALYQFAYKVEGKMYGRGVFISVNGYSHDSLKALTTGKALKTVLFDGGDLTLVIDGLSLFTDMLDKKVKAAQTMGLIYVDVFNMNEKSGFK